MLKVKLLRDTRITHRAGSIVEVDPATLSFLVSVGSAVEIADKKPESEPKTEKRATAKKK